VRDRTARLASVVGTAAAVPWCDEYALTPASPAVRAVVVAAARSVAQASLAGLMRQLHEALRRPLGGRLYCTLHPAVVAALIALLDVAGLRRGQAAPASMAAYRD
jgi:hypothetical protein